MKKYIVKRILSLIPVLIIVSVIVFFLMHLVPGDPAAVMLGDNATQEEIQALREQLGLNQLLIFQYFTWVGNMFHGNFGKSIFMEGSMLSILAEHFAPTVSLTVCSLVIALIIALPLGIIAAKRRGRMEEQAISGFTMIGISVPSFLMGLFLVMFLAVKMDWFPSSNYKSIKEYGLGLHLYYMVLPSVSLGLMQAALITRMTRSSVLEVLNCDYIKMAKAKGVTNFSLLVKHALRNAVIPIITVIGQSFIALLSGAAVVEKIFNIPGIGQLVVNSIGRRDYEVIQAIVLFIAIINILINLIIDLLYGLADPRIRLG
ncbi:ABC transporter permease [Lachnospiraceae bacterium 54-53]